MPFSATIQEREDGFSLVEILVVIVIIGILATIALPIYLDQRHKAGDASAKNDLYNTAVEIESYAGDVTSGGYTSVSPAALAADHLKVSVSPGTAVYLIQHTAKGFCLGAFNTNGSALPTNQQSFQGLASNVIYWWDSQAGGLQPVSTPISGFSGCPVTTGLAADAGSSSWS